MDNQHRKISGYRELSQEEIELMNKIKSLGPMIEEVVTSVQNHISCQYERTDNGGDDIDEYSRLCQADPWRWINTSIDHLQQGLMALTRAVAQPTFF